MKSLNSLIIRIVLMLSVIPGCFLVSCSNDAKAKRAIKGELRLTLNDFKSYESVQFGKLEVAFSSYEDLPEVELYLKKSDEWLEISIEYGDKAETYRSYYLKDDYYINQRLSSKAIDSATYYMNKINRLKLEYTPSIIGWTMSHSYRAKNLAGNLGIHHYLFYVDKNCKKVLKKVNISELNE